jgi:hypothetical protein
MQDATLSARKEIHLLTRAFLVRFQVLTAASMKITLFWNVAPCSLEKFTDVSDVFNSTQIRTIIALLMEAATTSETSVNFCQTTPRNVPEESYL